MRLCHNHVTEYEVISNLGSFCFSKHHHHPRRSWEGTAHLVVLKNQAKLLLPCSLPCKPFQSTGCLSSTCFLSAWFSQVSLPFFSWFFYCLPLVSHICSTCKIIIKQEACMKLPLLLIEMICPLTYKSRCFLAPRTSLKSFRCPEATTIHYTTTLLSTIGERMRRLPNWDRTMTKCLDVDPISVVWHHWLLQIRNFRNWFTATVGWPWFSTDLRVKTIGMII